VPVLRQSGDSGHPHSPDRCPQAPARAPVTPPSIAWAVYAGKTGDTKFLGARFSSPGPAGYEYLVGTVGHHLSRPPRLHPLLDDRTEHRQPCVNPADANWAAPGVYFNWAWNGYLLGATVTPPGKGTMADWIDKTLVAQRADGTLLVGRGIPDGWLASGRPIAAANVLVSDGRRIGVVITAHGGTVALRLTGAPAGQVIFEFPAIVNDIASASAGTVSEAAGTVTVPAGTHSVQVVLTHAPAGAAASPGRR